MAETKKRQPPEVLDQWIHKLVTDGFGLTRAERLMILDWQQQLDEGHGLTEVQEQKLKGLYDNHT